MTARIELTGNRYGIWTVLGFPSRRDNGQTTWLCRCDCGTEREVVAQTLRMGLTNSCGCQKGEKIARARTKHGHSGSHGKCSRAYSIWTGMLRRCNGSMVDARKYYFDRGITVCERWKDFKNFLADMGEPPEGRSIDRIDNDGNYEPGNCRWATASEQARNKRKPEGGVTRDSFGRFA